MKTLDKSMKVADFRLFLQQDLIPQLWSGSVVVVDNVPTYEVQYLSSYSLEFNPIEHLW